jgi:hypothetical protein
MPNDSNLIQWVSLIGKAGWTALAMSFAIIVTYVNNMRDHDEFRQADIETKKQLATSQALYQSLSADLAVLAGEVRADRRLSDERRETAQRDREEMKASLNILLERQ